MTGERDRRTTIDHDEIREWVERRGGEPATVADDGSASPGVLCIQFPDEGAGDRVEPLDWDAFFERFDARELALVYREADGERAEESSLDRWYEFEDRAFAAEF